MNDLSWKTVQQTTSLLCVRAAFEVAITHEENDVFTFSKKIWLQTYNAKRIEKAFSGLVFALYFSRCESDRYRF